MELVFEISFHHGDLVTTPLNLGPLPLLVLDLADVGNLLSSEVSVLQPGTAPEGFDFPEQKISIDATAEEINALTGEFALEFNGAVSQLMPINASAAVMTAALVALDTVGEVEVFKTESSTHREWLIRFYSEGDPAHIGPQPFITVNASTVSASTNARRRQLFESPLVVTLVSEGSTTLEVGNVTQEDDITANSTDAEELTVTTFVP